MTQALPVYKEGRCAWCGNHDVVHITTQMCARLGCINERRAAGRND